MSHTRNGTVMQNKLVIFDLDGVLVDSRDLHYEALNAALREVDMRYVIPKTEHLSTYDGLSTTRKLELLSEKRGLPKSTFNRVWKRKQELTKHFLMTMPPNKVASEIFTKLNERGWRIAIASNSIRSTVCEMLHRLGLLPLVSYIASNEDVKYPKPYPEIYWNCMQANQALPSQTIIVEDSHIGRKGATEAGGRLYTVKDPSELKVENFMSFIHHYENNWREKLIPWKDTNLNVLIPMAGAGSRFVQMGYTFPKPLIDVLGKPMIQVVIDSLNIEANYIYLCQRSHFQQYHLDTLLNRFTPNAKFVLVDQITEGAACTALLAKSMIDNPYPLVIANSDQYIQWDSNECMYAFSAEGIDGGILTFNSQHPKWSYVEFNEEGFVQRVAEKEVISNQATCGVYYWKTGQDFVKYAEQMIAKNIRVNDEFYICPVYNEAIADGKRIRAKMVEDMWGLGDPESLTAFINAHN